MQINTTRFGTIEVPDSSVIHFPNGLYGLNGNRRFCLLRHDDGPFRFLWLQAADCPSLAMVVVDPFEYFPDYEVEIATSAAEMLHAEKPGDIAIYAGVTIDRSNDAVYANLLGPMVINHTAAVGAQLIQDGNRYTTRHPISRVLSAAAAG